MLEAALQSKFIAAQTNLVAGVVPIVRQGGGMDISRLVHTRMDDGNATTARGGRGETIRNDILRVVVGGMDDGAASSSRVGVTGGIGAAASHGSRGTHSEAGVGALGLVGNNRVLVSWPLDVLGSRRMGVDSRFHGGGRNKLVSNAIASSTGVGDSVGSGLVGRHCCFTERWKSERR